LLFVNSARDEAYNFLAGVLGSRNPLGESGGAPRSNWRVRLKAHLASVAREDRREYPRSMWLTLSAILFTLGLGALAARLSGGDDGDALSLTARCVVTAPIFLGGFLLMVRPGPISAAASLPWRACVFVWRTAASLARQATIGHVRRRAWRDFQAAALGLLGSPHRVDDVGVHLVPPEKYSEGEWNYEPLTAAAEDFALAQRERSIAAAMERAMTSPDADLWSIDRWRERVSLLAADTQLVHTVYYRHPDCIQQIAAHLVRSDDEMRGMMERRKAKLKAAKGASGME
jgi:hypothetical protein